MRRLLARVVPWVLAPLTWAAAMVGAYVIEPPLLAVLWGIAMSVAATVAVFCLPGDGGDSDV